MTNPPELGRVWRVGLASDPLGFIPTERRSYNNRFDDLKQRFGTLHCAMLAETALREVLADLRPNAAAIARYMGIHGPQAAADIPSAAVSGILAPASCPRPRSAAARWPGVGPHRSRPAPRRRAAPCAGTRRTWHGAPGHARDHDPRRVVTQTSAGDAFERLGMAAICFASRLDGLPCYALFQGRGSLASDGDLLALTDPAPEALQNVAASWRLTLQPTTTTVVPPATT